MLLRYGIILSTGIHYLLKVDEYLEEIYEHLFKGIFEILRVFNLLLAKLQLLISVLVGRGWL
jgi:hypothetical protein